MIHIIAHSLVNTASMRSRYTLIPMWIYWYNDSPVFYNSNINIPDAGDASPGIFLSNISIAIGTSEARNDINIPNFYYL